MAEQGFPAQLWAMADLFTPMALRVAATLRLADHVADGADSVGALAQRAECAPEALGRLVDHLVAVGVLRRRGADGVSLTDLGEQLREGHPGRARAWLDIEGSVGRAELSALRLLDAVRSGEPAYPLIYGLGFWEDLAGRPEMSESFDALMAARLGGGAQEIAAGYEWGTLGSVVDVGGGNGTLLAAILAAHPDLRGTLVDLPGPAAGAASTLAEAGVADRCEVIPGSFFQALPSGADAYLLCGVLHDWDDAHALAILRRCAQAAGAAGRVLVIEDGLLESVESSLRSEMNLRMLAYTGGRERTLSELQALALGAGLRVRATRHVARLRGLADLRSG